MPHTVRTTCNRDCPDACGMLADVEDGRVVRLRGDPEHPVTRGFLCFRTNRFPERQVHPSRLTQPLLRRGDRQVPIGWEEALDFAAERLLAIRAESGPAAILHYRSGGSLGMLAMLADLLFARFGPVTVKRGDICSGAGDAAQLEDFGVEDSNDVFDLLNSRHIINWGKNLHVSNVHLIPIVEEARRRGASVTLIDPVYTRSAKNADHYLQVRPGGDVALALAVLSRLFARGAVSRAARALCDHVEALEALLARRSLPALLAEADIGEADLEGLVDRLVDGPAAILVGWGMQRRLLGASTVRLLDAISALSGNLCRPGGGVSFYFKRRGAFDSALFGEVAPPRELWEPLLGRQLLEAKDPPIRAVWITAANPVAMLPDSATVARALEQVELSVVVDAFETDTTRRASLVLPTTTLLESDDLLGAYGHHYLGVSQPVIPPPPGVPSELELLQRLAARLGLAEVLAGSARDWKRRLLAPAAAHGVTLEALEEGAKKSPFAKPVLFAEGRFETASGRVNLIHALPEVEAGDAPGYPLHLLSNSSDRSQSSQWAVEQDGLLPATVHPDAAVGLPDGAPARLISAQGALSVRLVHDARQRRDVVVVPKGGHFDRGWAANALIPARLTDLGGGAAYLDARVRIEPAL